MFQARCIVKEFDGRCLTAKAIVNRHLQSGVPTSSEAIQRSVVLYLPRDDGNAQLEVASVIKIERRHLSVLLRC